MSAQPSPRVQAGCGTVLLASPFVCISLVPSLCSCCRTPWSSMGSPRKPASSWEHASNNPLACAELASGRGGSPPSPPSRKEQQQFPTAVTK